MMKVKKGSNLKTGKRHIEKTISSTIEINGEPETIWDNITHVKIERFSAPVIFKLLDIPEPSKAEMLSEGVGGKRIAYFDNGKKSVQEILTWTRLTEYSFAFNPEKGFRVCYFFELSEGVFQVPEGAYYLNNTGQAATLRLSTTYSIDRRLYFLFNIPVRLILKVIQRYLLTSIKKNVEQLNK